MRAIEQKEISSLLWLARTTKLDDRLLGNVLIKVRNEEMTYSVLEIPKPLGGRRTISVPDPLLRYVQRAINKHILSDIPCHPAAFGFSGGSIADAIRPHLKSKIILSFDVVDAFGQVRSENALRGLLEGRRLWWSWGDTAPTVKRYGHMSWFAAKIVVDISFFWYGLPQGAPTSPRLFDQSFKIVDGLIANLAKKVGGVYTRYADNIFFSLPDKNYFSPKLERAVLRVLARREWEWHKRSIRRMGNGRAVSMLGLNVIDGQIVPHRDYKRRIRLAQHHVRHLLDHGLPFEGAWLRLKGQMEFGRLGVLPTSLVEGYESLREEIEEI